MAFERLWGAKLKNEIGSKAIGMKSHEITETFFNFFVILILIIHV